MGRVRRESFSGEASFIVDRSESRSDAVLLTDLVIFHAVSRCHVDETSTGSRCDKVCRDEARSVVFVLEHVGARSVFILQLGTIDAVDNRFDCGTFGKERQDVLDPVFGEEILILRWLDIFGLTNAHDSILDVPVESDGLVRRQGPGRGGPDQRICILRRRTFRLQGSRKRHKRHLDKSSRTSVLVIILQLSLSQSGARRRRPMNRTMIAENETYNTNQYSCYLQCYAHAILPYPS